MTSARGNSVIGASIMSRMKRSRSIAAWTANDFLDLGSRSAVDKGLQNLIICGQNRRIDRRLYDLRRISPLTGRLSTDYAAVIDAVATCDKARLLLDGITAANQLGLADDVPAKITLDSDARISPIRIGQRVIQFKLTGRLYRAGRPAGLSRKRSTGYRRDFCGRRLNPQANQKSWTTRRTAKLCEMIFAAGRNA